jgi:hypothetical protein
MAEGHCVWIGRAARELVGQFDPAYQSQQAALIDFSQRCAHRGLLNLLVDDLYVASAQPKTDAPRIPSTDRELLEKRYPYLNELLDQTRPWNVHRSNARHP